MNNAALSASPRASNRLTRRREGAEIGSAVLIRLVGRGCTRRRKRTPRATRQTQTILDKTHQHPCWSVVSVPIRVLFRHPLLPNRAQSDRLRQYSGRSV